MEDLSLSGIAESNESLPIQVQNHLEGEFADTWHNYRSMPHSYGPGQDEYSVLSYYQERSAENTQREEISKRFSKHHGGAADKTLRSASASFIEDIRPAHRLPRC